MSIGKLLFILILAGAAFATDVSGCPATLNASTSYTLTQNVTATATCFTMGGNNIVLDCAGYTITGPGSGTTYGVYATGKTNVTVANCTIRNFRYDVYLLSTNSSWVTNNILSDSAWSGFYMVTSFYNNVTNNTINNATSITGIQLQSSADNNISGNIVTDNSISGSGTDILLSTTAPMNESYCNNIIENNTGSGGRKILYYNHSVVLENEEASSIMLCNADNSVLRNVTLIASSNNRLDLYFADNVTIDGFTAMNVSSFVYAPLANKNISISNVFVNRSMVGMWIVEMNDSTVSNVTFLNNNPYWGIFIRGNTNNNVFDGITLINGTSDGFYVRRSAGGIIAQNNTFTNVMIINHTSYLKSDNQTALELPNTLINITFCKDESSAGCISWDYITLSYANMSTSSAVGTLKLESNFASVNSSSLLATQFTSSANVTLSAGDCSYSIFTKAGFPTTRGDITANGTLYSPLSRSCSNNLITFGVSGFSGYASGTECTNLSDITSWRTIVNSSGVLYVNANTTLCTDTYYLNNATSTAQVIQMNASNIFLNCNQSIIDGVDRNGYGIYIIGKENNTIENCTARNYEVGIYVYNNAKYNRVAYSTAYNTSQGFYLKTTVSNNTLISNTAYSNSYAGFFLYIGATNNTLINNTAYNNVYFGFSLQTNSNGNTLISNTAYNNSPFGFDVSSSSNNTFTDSIAFGNFEYAGFNGYGIEIDALSSNSISNTFINTLIYNQSSYIYQKATAAQSNNFTNLTLGYNSTIGLVNFAFLNITNLYLNSSNLKLDPYFVSLNDSSAPQANLSANITLASVCNSTVQPSVYKLAGFPASRAAIVSGGSVYPTESSCGSGVMTFNVSSFSGYALGPITTTLSLNISPSNLTTYKTETNVSCTASNGVVAIGLYVNGTLVAGPSASHIEYLTNHSGGYYNYTCNTTGDGNYSAALNSSVLQMQKGSPTITFNVSPSTPITVGNETNLSCSVDNTQVTVGIFINDVSVGSAVQQFEYLQNLSVGTYNFTCNTTGNENYTNASGSMNGYEVEKRNTTLDLTIPYPRPMVGEQTNVSCMANTDEVNISLYRNGVRVANGTVQIDDVAVLPPALYTYVCNTTGSDNYTSYSTSGILQFQRSSTASSSSAQCHLGVVVPAEVTAGSAAQLQVVRYTNGISGNTSVYLATVAIVHGGEAATLTTSTNGYVSFVPAETGTYAYAAEFGDCEGTDGTFTAVETEEELPVEEVPAVPTEEPSTEPTEEQTSGQSGGQPSEVEVPSAPECTIDADCGSGFGCQGGTCVEVAGQPAAEGEESPAVGATSVPQAQPQGVPWWAWLLIPIILGAGAWWFLARKKA